MADELPLPLPKHVVLRNRLINRYMRFTHEDIQQHGFLQFTGETVVSPYVRFEIEPSRTARGLVHIRSTYNNKYCKLWSRTQWWITATADSPDEDQSQWSCTLFKPVYVSTVDNVNTTGTKNLRIRLLHVNLNRFISLYVHNNSTYTNFVIAALREPNTLRIDVFDVIDWGSIVVLPKHVAFKGDQKKFIRARVIRGNPHLEFGATSNADPEAGHEVLTNTDGSVRIRSNHYRDVWRRVSYAGVWIFGDSSNSAAQGMGSNAVFWPVKLGGNVIALRNMGNNLFVKRLSRHGIESCLAADDPTISEYARLEVEEAVLSRRIDNVNFRLLDARIYNETVKTMAGTTIFNNSAQTNTSTMRLTYANTSSRSWQSSVSFSYGVKSTISSGVPVIGEGTVEIGWQVSTEYTWGETHESSQTVEVDYTVTVGPYTMMIVRLLATEATCDVPFSYTQTDTLYDGRQVATQMHDGIYTGVNSFSFKWENTEQKLTAQEIELAQAQEGEGNNIKLRVEKGEAKIIATKEKEEEEEEEEIEKFAAMEIKLGQEKEEEEEEEEAEKEKLAKE